MPVRAAALAALAVLLGADAGLAQAQITDPLPASNVLRGERRLLPLDDVMVFRWNQSPDGQFLAPEVVFLVPEDSLLPPELGALVSRPFQTQAVHYGTAAGNMFARPGDTIAQAIGSQLFLYLLGSTDPVWSGTMPNPVSAARTQLSALIRPLMAMADFTGDGFADIVIGSPNGNGGLQVATAVDVTDPSQGVRWGELLSPVNAIAGSALAAGDLDGDGLPEVALAFPSGSFGPGNPATAFRVEIYKVSPTTLALQFQHSATVFTATYGQGNIPIRKVSIAAGDFDNDVSDLGLADEELVVTASGEDANDGRFVIQTFKVSSTLQPFATTNWMVSSTDGFSSRDGCCGFVSTVVESGRLDWTGRRDQAVVGISSLIPTGAFRPATAFWILDFNDDMTFEPFKQLVPQQTVGGCHSGLRGLAIGNFDRPSSGESFIFPQTLNIATIQGFGVRQQRRERSVSGFLPVVRQQLDG